MPKKTKQIIPAKKALETDKNYQALLDELKSIIAKGQFKAYKGNRECIPNQTAGCKTPGGIQRHL